MRKSLILLLVTAILLFGGICYISLDLDSVKDQVVYEEKIFYGDSSVTEGLTIKNNVQFDQKLFWDTTYEAGPHPKTTTHYRFYTTNQPAHFESQDHFSIDSFWDSYSSSSNGYPRIFEDLIAETKPGKTSCKRVYLKDYYEYYPVSLDIWINDHNQYAGWDTFYMENNKEVESDTVAQAEAFNKFFQIPIVDTHSMDVEISMNSFGQLESSHSSSTDEDYFSFATWFVVTEDAFYFTFNPHTQNGSLIDTSHIPGGYGIYCLPYRIEANKHVLNIDAENLAMVYSLDPRNTISSMELTEDKSKILLFSTDEENTGSQLIVIDAATMETTQIIPVPGIPLEDGATEILHASDHFIYKDFAAYSCTGDYVAVFPFQEDGSLSLAFVHPVYPEPNFYYWIHSESYMDWDGEKLAVASPNAFCDFSLAVYDKTGLLYFGTMESSLAKGGNSYHRGYIMNQDAKYPYLTVEWKN